MPYLIENESIYLIGNNKNKLVEEGVNVDKIAFFIDKEEQELSPESNEQLQKIIASTKQDVAKTIVINAFTGSISFHQLQKCGVQVIVVFSSNPLPVFSSVNISKGKAFSISGLEVFVVSGLDTFRSNDMEKKALWAFIKPKI